jgi:hypothetical protein
MALKSGRYNPITAAKVPPRHTPTVDQITVEMPPGCIVNV